jgi:exodeoxyribonuclease VII large subunit
MNPDASSLSEITGRIRQVLKDSFQSPEWVVVEISDLKVNASGHCYMELIEKDSLNGKILARARGIIWAYTFRILKPYFETTTRHSLCAGLRVRMLVNVEFHEVYGFSLVIQDIDPTYTLGDLARQRFETIARLEKEGVVNMNRELELAPVPQRLAIISSETAAGYEDFIDQINNNEQGFSFACQLFPALMQGEEAVASILAALDRVNKHTSSFDVVVIIRGGGSVAELSVFDDYWMACHVAQFPLPVLTGIGHEKDDSVVDLVAHTRLKTPTAVAEFLIDRMSSFENQLMQLFDGMLTLTRERLAAENDHLEDMLLAVRPLITQVILKETRRQNLLTSHFSIATKKGMQQGRQHLSSLSGRLQTGAKLRIATGAFNLSNFRSELKHHSAFQLMQRGNYLDKAESISEHINPQHILRKGYSITMANGKILRHQEAVQAGDEITTILHHGRIKSLIQQDK